MGGEDVNPRIQRACSRTGRIRARHRALAEHAIEPDRSSCRQPLSFRATVAGANASFDEAIENVDIGGLQCCGAAAKNHQSVALWRYRLPTARTQSDENRERR